MENSVCINCKHYMCFNYKNGKGGIKKQCLKLRDELSASILIVKCNKFKSGSNFKNSKPLKT